MKSHLSEKGTPGNNKCPPTPPSPLQTTPLFGLINREGEERCYPLAPDIRGAWPQQHSAIDRLVLPNETLLPFPSSQLVFRPSSLLHTV